MVGALIAGAHYSNPPEETEEEIILDTNFYEETSTISNKTTWEFTLDQDQTTWKMEINITSSAHTRPQVLESFKSTFRNQLQSYYRSSKPIDFVKNSCVRAIAKAQSDLPEAKISVVCEHENIGLIKASQDSAVAMRKTGGSFALVSD